MGFVRENSVSLKVYVVQMATGFVVAQLWLRYTPHRSGKGKPRWPDKIFKSTATLKGRDANPALRHHPFLTFHDPMVKLPDCISKPDWAFYNWVCTDIRCCSVGCWYWCWCWCCCRWCLGCGEMTLAAENLWKELMLGQLDLFHVRWSRVIWQMVSRLLCQWSQRLSNRHYSVLECSTRM